MAWTPAALCAVWALVRALGFDSGYPLVPLMTYTPYVLPVAVLGTAVALALRQWLAAAVASIAALTLFVAIAPRILGGESLVSGGSLGVMSANVLKGTGDPEQLVRLARERDVSVLAVQELTPSYVAELKAAGIGEILPHSVLEAEPGVSGTGIYSSSPIRALPPIPSGFRQARGTIGRPGSRFEIVSVHLVPPTSGGAVTRWRNGMEALPDSREGRTRRLLLGDFNSTLDNGAFRDLLDRGYTDAGESFGGGLQATWPAFDKPWRYLPVTIDHVLTSGDSGVFDYEVIDLDGSDHRVVYAEIARGDS